MNAIEETRTFRLRGDRVLIGALLGLAACGVCLQESPDPLPTGEQVSLWECNPALTPIWNRRAYRQVHLEVDSTDDAVPFQETVDSLVDQLCRTMNPSDGVVISFGEPVARARLAPFLHAWKVYSLPGQAFKVRIPQEVANDQAALENQLLEILSGAEVRESGAQASKPFGREDARRLAEALAFEEVTREIDYDRLLAFLRPEEVPDGTYVIHLWSDRISSRSGGGLSSWAPGAPAIIRLERSVIENQAILHISTRTVERVSALHELGHILGLVRNPAHHRAGHCTNPACIMYPGRVNARTVLANVFTGLAGQPKSSFCGECEADLERYREAMESGPD